MLTLNLCYDCEGEGGGGFQNSVLTLFIPEGGVLVRGHNILLILLVTGGMMEGVNPIGHICINMHSHSHFVNSIGHGGYDGGC